MLQALSHIFSAVVYRSIVDLTSSVSPVASTIKGVAMRYNNFIFLLNDAIENGHIQRALDAIKTFQPADLADVLAQLPIKSSLALLLLLPERAYVFSYLNAEQQINFANALPRATLAEIIGEMPSDKRVDLYKHLDEQHQNALLPALAQAEREDLRQLAAYVEGTAVVEAKEEKKEEGKKKK